MRERVRGRRRERGREGAGQGAGKHTSFYEVPLEITLELRLGPVRDRGVVENCFAPPVIPEETNQQVVLNRTRKHLHKTQHRVVRTTHSCSTRTAQTQDIHRTQTTPTYLLGEVEGFADVVSLRRLGPGQQPLVDGGLVLHGRKVLVVVVTLLFFLVMT